MTFNSSGALTAVESLVDGVSTVTASEIGVPKGIADRVMAYLFLIPDAVSDKTTGALIQQQIRVRVVFAYRTGGDVRAAELALAAAHDEFKRDYYLARENFAGGHVLFDSELDATVASGAEYELMAGDEYRRMPVDVVVRQQQNVLA